MIAALPKKRIEPRYATSPAGVVLSFLQSPTLVTALAHLDTRDKEQITNALAWDFALDPEHRLTHTVDGFLIALLVVSLAGVPVLVSLGQGGARLEGAADAAPLPDALADDRYWKLGLLYFNRADPSFLVEHRFGIGYTLNLANKTAVVCLVAFLGLLLAVATAAAFA